MQSSLLQGRTRFALIFALALAGFFLFPAVTFASPLSMQSRGDTASFAFIALTDPGPVGGAPLAGGLVVHIGDDGYYHGQLHQPGGVQFSVSGLIERDESLSITVYSIQGIPLIKGRSTYREDGKYTGTFDVYSGSNLLASGIWSAIALAPDTALGFAFNSVVLSGEDANLVTVGVLVLKHKTLKGYLLQSDGLLMTARARLSNECKNIRLALDHGKIIATGLRASGPQLGPKKGYTGQLQGPASNDRGTWTAFQFSF